MKYVELTFEADAAGTQNQLMDKIKSCGGDVIQTSRGLVAKLEESVVSDLSKTDGVTWNEITTNDIEACPPDVKAFLTGS